MAKRSKKPTEDLFRETTMTFGEHLEELRSCLFKALVGLVLGFIIGLGAAKYVVPFIQAPLTKALSEYYQTQAQERIEANLEQFSQAGYLLPEDADEREKLFEELFKKKRLIFEKVYVNPREVLRRLGHEDSPRHLDEPPAKPFGSDDLKPIYMWHLLDDDDRVQTKSLSAHEPFVIYIKAALVVGALVASPWIFYQIWMFVAAGLYPREKHYVHVFLPFSLGLFLAGAALAFFCVFEPVLKFLFYFNDALGIAQDIRITEWLGFVLILPLGFGISFQLPLVMLFLERIGVFDIQAYLSKWRVAILVIFVLAMFLTPADPTSMMLMAGPLTVLYFLGILLCRLLPRSQSPFDSLDE